MGEKNLTLRVLFEKYSVCQLLPGGPIPEWAATASFHAEFFSITWNAEECSIVCPTHLVPGGLQVEEGWKAFQVIGVLDFALIGILAALTGVLAQVKVSVFALSTYNTDYLLVKEKDLELAIQALREAGYHIE